MVSFIVNKDYLVNGLRTQRKTFRYPEERIENQYCSSRSVAEAQRGLKWVDKLTEFPES